MDRRLALIALLAFGLALGAGCDREQRMPDHAEPGAPQASASAPGRSDSDQADDERAEPAGPRSPTATQSADEKSHIQTLWGANVEHGVAQAELRDLDEAEEEQIAGLFSGEYAKADAVPYRASRMPERFHEVEELDVLTPKGPVRVAIAEVVRGEAPDHIFYMLRSAKSAALAPKASATLATPAGQMAADASMRYEQAKPVHAKAAPVLKRAFFEGLDPAERKHVQKVFADEQMTAVSARFPAPHGQVVAINVPSPKLDVPLAQALFVAKETGEVTHVIREPYVGALGDIVVLAVADPNGDGIDGVLYRRYTDGSFLKWIDFDEDGNVHVETLAGFSA